MNENSANQSSRPDPPAGQAWWLAVLYLLPLIAWWIFDYHRVMLLAFVPAVSRHAIWVLSATLAKARTGRTPPGYFLLSMTFLCVLVVMVWTLRWGSPPRQPSFSVRSDHRSLATAIEAYKLDHGVYPAHTFDRRETVGARTAAEFEARHGRVPTFRTRGTTELQTITTPVAYLTSLFEDVFLRDEFPDHGYAYWTDGGGWIVWSPGPDGEYAIKDPSEVYTSEVSQPSLTLLLHAFDPTNGTTSPGDVWRVSQ